MKKMKLISSLSTLGVAASGIPIVATACSDDKDKDEVVAGYSIKCMTADGDTLTTQPGQFEKFALFYKDVKYTYDDEPYIFWSLEVIGGDKSVSPVFMDNYIGAPGCGYLYVSYLNSGEWKTGQETKIRVTASSYEYGTVLARKTITLKRSPRTFYTPKESDLTLMNTVQFIDQQQEQTFPLKLNEDLGDSISEVKSVTWELDSQLSTPRLANIIHINNGVLELTGSLPTGNYLNGYLTIKAKVANYDKPLYLCVNASVAKNKITYEELASPTLTGQPYNYCNYFFVKIQNAANPDPIKLFQLEYDSKVSPSIQPYWTLSIKKNAVVSSGALQTSPAKPDPVTTPVVLQLGANSTEFKSQGYFCGTINLYDYSTGSNVLMAQRNVVVSVVDEATFEAVKNL